MIPVRLCVSFFIASFQNVQIIGFPFHTHISICRHQSKSSQGLGHQDKSIYMFIYPSTYPTCQT